jgi:type 1 glutamine amidotransferase
MRIIRLLTFILFISTVTNPIFAEKRGKDDMKILIVDGFSNHDWEHTTRSIVKILNEYGGMKIDVSTSPNSSASKEQLENWNPDFQAYDIVMLNCNDLGKPVRWSDKTRRNLEKFVSKGGGLYIFHSANNAFEDWGEYNRMIGMGWRKKDFGKAITIDDNQSLKIIEHGEGENTSHGKRINALTTRIGDHPIQKALPRSWVYADIEVYTYARGPIENVTILSYAKDEKYRLNFPVEWVIKYGKGNVYNSSLGHCWKDQENPEGLRCAAFQTEMVRAIQWLAKRKVDTSLPKDFPGTSSVSLRDNL